MLQGILYEDTALQVGLQSRYNRSTGELLLFLGNKQAGAALTGVSLVLLAASPAVQVVLGQPPGQLAPKQQVQVSTGDLGCCPAHVFHVLGRLGSQMCTVVSCRFLCSDI